MTHVAMGCSIIFLTEQASLTAGLTSHRRVLAYQTKLQQCSTAESAWVYMFPALQNPGESFKRIFRHVQQCDFAGPHLAARAHFASGDPG